MKTMPHILVVESNPDLRQLFGMVLERGCYRATLVAEGHAALAQLASGEFDLALVDYRLPEMPGDALIDAIHHQGIAVKTVLMDYPPDSWVIAHNHQADGFFRKVDIIRLCAFIARLLDSSPDK